jgi:uncharacterized RDD family membrane protein YckC
MNTVYAGFLKRFVALGVDGFILWTISAICGMVISLILPKSEGAHLFVASSGVLIVCASLIYNLAYFVCFESSKLQATPGKMILGIKVTDTNGKRISYWRSAGRYFARIISMVVGGCLMAGFTIRKQALHDKIAGTLVINKTADINNLQPLPKQPMWKIILICFGVLTPIFLLYYHFAVIIWHVGSLIFSMIKE